MVLTDSVISMSLSRSYEPEQRMSLRVHMGILLFSLKLMTLIKCLDWIPIRQYLIEISPI